jgi:hypothetical protein
MPRGSRVEMVEISIPGQKLSSKKGKLSFRTFFVFSLLGLLSSCATIISRSSYPVFIDSNPTEARLTVTDKDGSIVYQGHTPKTLKLDAGDGYFQRASYLIKFEHPDFETSTVRIESKVDGWYFGNIPFFMFMGMLVIDPLTGSMYRIDERTVYEKLQFKTYHSLNITPFDHLPAEFKAAAVEIRIEP